MWMHATERAEHQYQHETDKEQSVFRMSYVFINNRFLFIHYLVQQLFLPK